MQKRYWRKLKAGNGKNNLSNYRHIRHKTKAQESLYLDLSLVLRGGLFQCPNGDIVIHGLNLRIIRITEQTCGIITNGVIQNLKNENLLKELERIQLCLMQMK